MNPSLASTLLRIIMWSQWKENFKEDDPPSPQKVNEALIIMWQAVEEEWTNINMCDAYAFDAPSSVLSPQAGSWRTHKMCNIWIN